MKFKKPKPIETKKVFIFMGVSGCGKTTLAQAFARQFDMDFFDADDFHSTKAKLHMQSGKALDDEMRIPWIDRIIYKLNTALQATNHCALAYSGLRSRQRQTFLHLDAQIVYLHLSLPLEVAQKRLLQRKDHFFPAHLINSQYDSLEPALPSENIIELDATLPPELLLKQLIDLVGDIVD